MNHAIQAMAAQTALSMITIIDKPVKFEEAQHGVIIYDSFKLTPVQIGEMHTIGSIGVMSDPYGAWTADDVKERIEQATRSCLGEVELQAWPVVQNKKHRVRCDVDSVQFLNSTSTSVGDSSDLTFIDGSDLTVADCVYAASQVKHPVYVLRNQDEVYAAIDKIVDAEDIDTIEIYGWLVEKPEAVHVSCS